MGRYSLIAPYVHNNNVPAIVEYLSKHVEQTEIDIYTRKVDEVYKGYSELALESFEREICSLARYDIMFFANGSMIPEAGIVTDIIANTCYTVKAMNGGAIEQRCSPDFFYCDSITGAKLAEYYRSIPAFNCIADSEYKDDYMFMFHCYIQMTSTGIYNTYA